MSIDERLERLTERHEALTQSVELMQIEGQAQDKRIDKILATAELDAESIRGLARIAAIHEQRAISELENGGGGE